MAFFRVSFVRHETSTFPSNGLAWTLLNTLSNNLARNMAFPTFLCPQFLSVDNIVIAPASHHRSNQSWCMTKRYLTAYPWICLGLALFDASLAQLQVDSYYSAFSNDGAGDVWFSYTIAPSSDRMLYCVFGAIYGLGVWLHSALTYRRRHRDVMTSARS
jgi:hypothetical protein